MKKIVSFTIALILTVIQPIFTVNAIANDKNTVVISTVKQLEEFAHQCSLDSFSKGLNVKLANDLDCKDSSFTGIPYFCGTFDGCGYTVKHLMLSQDGSNIGFFRYTSKDARIRNISVEENVEPGGSACVVGGIASENDGVISNCTVIGNIKAIESAGGIAGKNTGIISSCSFSGSVSAEHRAGGISGENTGTILNCTNSGKIDTTLISVSDKKSRISLNFDVSELTEDDFLNITDIGGISGYSTGTILNCTNEGCIGYERIGYNVGGIAGRQSGMISKCINNGEIIGRKDVGGIVGQAEPYAVWDISETTLAELKNSLNDIQKNLDTFNKGLKDNSPEIKKATENLKSCVDKTAKDTEKAINIASGNISEAENTANRLISLISTKIDEHNSPEAGKMIDELSKLANDTTLDINTSGLTELLEKLRSQDSDHDLTISIKSDLEKIKNRTSTYDSAKTEDSKHRSKSGRTVEELTTDIESAIDSKDIKIARQLTSELLSLIESGAKSIDINAIDIIISKLSNLENSYISEAGSLGNSVEDILASVSFTRPDVKQLKTDADSIANSAGELRSLISKTSGSAKEDAKKVLDSCSSLAGLFSESDTDIIQLQTDYQTDISAFDSEKYKNGVVKSSENYGKISADTNVGGIAGNMACEIDIDAEDQIKIPAYMLQNARYVVFAVLSDCFSGSDITAKKDCTGGIVGNADFGAVIDCEASGTINGGDYCGGVAGKNSGNISDSYSRCLLYGDKFVGGIAGEGCDISDCRAYSYVKSDKECSGSIAGNITGSAENCLFVENGVGGIDGISYNGIAEPLSYSEMMTLPDIPEWFKKISVTFVAGGNTVAVKEVEFGGSIDKLPDVERDGTRYWKWNDFDNNHIYYSQTIEGEYKDPKTTISTNEDIPLFLAEGNFYEGQKLTVRNETSDIAIEKEKGNLIGAYTININGADSILRIRMKMADKGSLYTLTNGKWTNIDYQTDGSYIVFDMENGGTIAFFGKRLASVPVWAIVTGSVAFVALISAIIISTKRKKAASVTHRVES